MRSAALISITRMSRDVSSCIPRKALIIIASFSKNIRLNLSKFNFQCSLLYKKKQPCAHKSCFCALGGISRFYRSRDVGHYRFSTSVFNNRKGSVVILRLKHSLFENWFQKSLIKRRVCKHFQAWTYFKLNSYLRYKF